MAKEAFCLMKWRANGGLLDSEGRPTGTPVQSLCEEDEDYCPRCPYLLRELTRLTPGHTYWWVCSCCADTSLAVAKEHGIDVQIPGYYASGSCTRPRCTRKNQYHPDEKYSPTLQLLLVFDTRVP